MKKRYYAITIIETGEVYGIPAEIIADNYAKYYAGKGEDYQENFNTMMEWFDTDDFEFADWAKNSINWDDVKEYAVLLEATPKGIDFQESWINGEYQYFRSEAE